MMKTLLRACAVAFLVALFHAATVGWSFGTALSSFLTGTTLVLACDGIAGTPRIERIAILTWLYWGLSYVSNLIEALYFRVIPVIDARRSAISGLVIALLAACILEWLTPAKRQQQHHRVRTAPHLLRNTRTTDSPAAAKSAELLFCLVPRPAAFALWWRIPLLALLFFVIYLSAGIAINPWIKSFYQDRPLPSLGQLAALQFCRGLLDVACIFPLFRRWAYSRQRAAWLSACVFTVLCGWGPLLLPNHFLPAPIRLAHGFEMGASGIVFGIITAMLLLRTAPATSAEIARPDRDGLAV